MKVIQNLHRWLKAKESLRKRTKIRTQLLHCVHETLGRFKHPQLLESRLEAHSFGEAHHLPCYLLGREVECCMNDWQSWAFYWAAFFFFNGLSSCEILHSSHGRYESSLEPDPSWNARSLIQADALPWPRNLGKRHCDKVASYLTAFLLK